MKRIFQGFVVTAAAAIVAGCASEKIMVDYVMPAKAVCDINSVNVVKIDAKATVSGNQAGDNTRNAAMLRQMLAAKLYKEGYYKVVDSISGDPEGALSVYEMIQEKDSGHGYASFGAMEQSDAKATLSMDLELTLDTKPVKKNMDFTLTTQAYNIDKSGKTPVGKPAGAPVISKESREVEVFETVAKGVLKAKFVGADGGEAPVAYEKSFEIDFSGEQAYAAARPTQMSAFEMAVAAAIDGVVADISPYKETRPLEAVAGGDKRVATLLEAKAFAEVVSVVTQLALIRKANYADFENLGIAYEATGDFASAKGAFASALACNPESASAKAGKKRAEDALAGKRAIRESGAKANKDTQFSK